MDIVWGLTEFSSFICSKRVPRFPEIQDLWYIRTPLTDPQQNLPRAAPQTYQRKRWRWERLDSAATAWALALSNTSLAEPKAVDACAWRGPASALAQRALRAPELPTSHLPHRWRLPISSSLCLFLCSALFTT